MMTVVCLAGIAFAASAAQASTYLTYTLSDALKKSLCIGDTDNDCLDNAREQDLAWIASPNYLWDEDEGCDRGNHFGMHEFYQVRPFTVVAGEHVTSWHNDSSWKYVMITYFLNYPHDCNQFSGHQGDDEKVEITMASKDLVTWELTNARMYHHFNSNDYVGPYIATIADNVGTPYMNVAYDEDGHGSWPGAGFASSECDSSARMSASGCDVFGCDCFEFGSLSSSYDNGQYFYLDVSRNIGGPSPEVWNEAVMTNDGTFHYYSAFDTGHGTNLEYWTAKGGKYSRFCGWECPSATRGSDGHCIVDAHDNHECTDPLSSKVNTFPFSY